MYSENEIDEVVLWGVPNSFLLSGLTSYLLQQQYSVVVKIKKEITNLKAPNGRTAIISEQSCRTCF